MTPIPSDPNERTETFKRATAAVLKAIGHVGEIEVAFDRAGMGMGEGRVRLPEPDEGASPDFVRGAADTAAVHIRYHDADLHAQHRPVEGKAAAAFDALEQARCEAMAARRLRGLGRNVSAWLERRVVQAGLRDAKTVRDVPLDIAMHLRAQKELSRLPLGEESERVSALCDKKLSPSAAHWDSLRDALADQEAFALQSRQMLSKVLPESLSPESSETPQQRQAPSSEDPPNDPSGDKAGAQEQKAQSDAAGDEAIETDTQTQESDGQDSQSGESDSGDQKIKLAGANEADHTYGPVTTYRAYTTAFDEVIKAEDLCSPRELARLRRLLDQQLRPVQNVVVRLANKLQRRLMAQQMRSWIFDLEEGVIDAARLARVVANPLLPLSYKMEKETDFRDTVVSLLIDNSGSMRGRPITLAAISADILSRTLERCGVKTEVLGFTTRAWKGGQAREVWFENGKPARPGRLNDLRHIVYKEADTPSRRARSHLGLMLREGLLKENIDGEALLWAHDRLLRRAEDRRILMVISDGAPVDDSTLSVNPSNYLDAHLRAVIDWIETRSPIELCAIGIGHDVTKYYSRAVRISSPDDLGGTMTEQLAALFERQWAQKRAR